MTTALAALVRLSAALGSGDEAALEEAMAIAARDAERGATEEVLLQSYLFLGYPAALRALGAWRERAGGPAARTEGDDHDLWRARGEQVCERVYGGAYGRLRANVAALHPDLERWMLEEGYGKVLGRPGLELWERELCTVALLAGLRAPHQLHSHLRGALNTGATPVQVDQALELAGAVLSGERVDAARAVWQAVRGRWEERKSARES